MRKVYVELKVKLIINADDGVDIGDVINELDYSFEVPPESAIDMSADIEDTEILDYEITDSK